MLTETDVARRTTRNAYSLSRPHCVPHRIYRRCSASPPGPATMAAEYCVLAFDTLTPARPDGEAVALALLKQAAWQVQPIMKRRQWRILMLRELEPENMTRGVAWVTASERLAPDSRSQVVTTSTAASRCASR